jgi:TRAP-type C4-dicarboxylate transport system permease small subunit
MRPSDRAIQVPITVFAWIGGIAITLMMLHVVADVGARLFFNSPLDGTTEIVSRFYMVLVIFFPLGYVCHHEGHILVELFTKGLPRRRLAALEFAIGLVTVAFVAWFTWETLSEALTSYETNEMAETADSLITVWPSRFVLPIGICLMGIYCIYRTVEDWQIASGRRD